MKTFCLILMKQYVTRKELIENSKPISTRIDQINNLKLKETKLYFLLQEVLLVVTIYMTYLQSTQIMGVDFDELYLGKPAADYYIDDKGKIISLVYKWLVNY